MCGGELEDEFRVSDHLLSCGAEYFRSMLEAGWKEGGQEAIQLQVETEEGEN